RVRHMLLQEDVECPGGREPEQSLQLRCSQMTKPVLFEAQRFERATFHLAWGAESPGKIVGNAKQDVHRGSLEGWQGPDQDEFAHTSSIATASRTYGDTLLFVRPAAHRRWPAKPARPFTAAGRSRPSGTCRRRGRPGGLRGSPIPPATGRGACRRRRTPC